MYSLRTLLQNCGALVEAALTAVWVVKNPVAAGQVATPVRYSQSYPAPHTPLSSESEPPREDPILILANRPHHPRLPMAAPHKSGIVRRISWPVLAVALAEVPCSEFAANTPLAQVEAAALGRTLSGSVVALGVTGLALIPGAGGSAPFSIPGVGFGGQGATPTASGTNGGNGYVLITW
jgi:hypothetical protein